MNHAAPGALRRRLIATGSLAAAAALAFTGCASGASSGSTDAAGGDDTVGVSLIVKTTTNPFFVAMQDGAEAAAEDLGVELTMAAGKEDGDEDTQIQAVENAISKGDAGILITPNGPAVEDALVKARDAGLFVIALDTPPSDPESVDITFATDNFLAGQKIGEWTAAKLAGEKATIAMIDLFDDKVVSVDVARDQGFLDGMGIDLADDTANGDEEASGAYSGGEYEIVGNEASQGAEDGGRTAAETLLSKNPDINVVYTINEPAAYGAYEAFKAAGSDRRAHRGLGRRRLRRHRRGEGRASSARRASSTRSRWPSSACRRSSTSCETGEAPENTEGLDFYNTGVELVTDDPQDGVESIDTTEAADICWG